MDWWRKIYLLHQEDPDSFSLPIWAHVRVRPDLVVIGDSSGHAGGGVILGLGIWFHCEWPEEIIRRLNDTNAGRDMDDSEKTTIAHLELAVIMVLGVGVMIENMQIKQPLPVLALCDITQTRYLGIGRQARGVQRHQSSYASWASSKRGTRSTLTHAIWRASTILWQTKSLVGEATNGGGCCGVHVRGKGID